MARVPSTKTTASSLERTHTHRPYPICDRPQLWIGGLSAYANPPQFDFYVVVAALSIAAACLKHAYLDRFDAFLLRASGNTEFAVTLCITGAVLAALATALFYPAMTTTSLGSIAGWAIR